jgi:5'-nucleotidase
VLWTAGLWLGLSGCALVGPTTEAPASAAQTVTLSIVGTNDLHGGILARDGRGGLALLGGYLKNLRAARARDGGAVLLLDAGDMFQGTLESNLTEGAVVVAAYNVLGYTAAAIGNHEFDYGPVGLAATPRGPGDDVRGALKARAREATFPFLAGNIIDAATGEPIAWPNVRPTAIVEAAGIKVGIIGLVTRGALTATIPINVAGLTLAPLADTVRAHATELRAQGAAVVLVTAHAGGRCTNFDRAEDLSSCDPSSEIFQLARELPRGLVDAIVAGHSHAPIGHQVEGIPITEAYSGGRAFGRIDLTVDRRAKAVTGRRSFAPRDLVQAEYEGAPVLADPAIERVLASAVERVRALKERPIGVVLDTPIRNLAPVSPLGNLFTDALLASVPGADVALHNSGGGLRAPLPAGPLTYGRVYEVMPFENLVARLRLTGRELRQVLAEALQRGRAIGFAGIRVRAQCANGALDVTMLRPSDAPIRDDEPLLVVASDFIATGGDGILTAVTPPGGFPVDHAAPLARDVFADYLGRMKSPLREEPLLEKDSPRLVVSGTLPLQCGGR